ncbi:MAG: hypothetical protein U0168_22345 [Nannocystaceae bacterium]
MPEITLQNATLVNVVPTLVGAQLVLSVQGVIIGTVIDEFDPPPPATMRLFVQDLASGQQVAAQWQPAAGGPWWPFLRVAGGVYADFPPPKRGAADNAYNFAVAVQEHGVHVDDPRLILRTKTSTESG